MTSEKDRALGLLGHGLLLLLMTAAAAAVESARYHAGPARFLLFVLLLFLGGALLCAYGWSRLQRLKRPEESWWRFLREELILVAIVLPLLGGFLAMGETRREALTKFLHDVAM